MGIGAGFVREIGSSNDDQRVLDALEQHDWDGALSELMDAYGSAVYRYCLRMVRDPQLAEDVLQETFVKAHRSLPGFLGRSSIRTWLYTIAHNRCIDLLRAEQRRLDTVDADDEAARHPDAGPSPEHHLAASELTHALRLCLDRLSAPVKAAVLARHQQDMTYVEMSEILGAQPAALERRVSRALPSLRRCLEQRGIRL